ncbi:MAG: hypothetical protein M1508_07970 [Nitrospirae bacterium]|nr:hypothetical protein [Nitrospirota bacterium]MCL5422521.1 hypothetical protein [Nitrospirota bacterium]
MRSKLTIIFAISALCYVAVPHPYCFSLDARKETATELHLFYKKNAFFLDCDRETRSIIRTEKDIVVYLDGNEQEIMRNKEVCARNN